MLAARTSFTPAREHAAACLPMADADLVRLLNDQTDEAARLMEEQPQAGIGGARDVRAALERARRGGRLTPQDLLEIGDTLHAAAALRGRLRDWRGPHLAGVRDDLDPAPDLAERIRRSVDDSGELLDTASPELGAIRRRLRTAQDRVRERLNAMVRSTQMAGIVGEPIVTLRAGRYVIPIRAEAKGRLRGIVHDQSASGATLFIEPLTVVDLNNAWTEATLAAEREEERILDELSREVEARAASLAASLDALARLDLWMARARLGRDLEGVRPVPTPDAVELLSARHPMLGSAVVPIDIRLGERFGYRAMIVTGPNTGGKTVSLKTLGLLTLMHQAGLRVPAADPARLPVFARVMADIGDEQSIAQSLSTFSSHLRNVIRFLEAAGPETLVLLDEVGAGTDPTEGSALAMAIVAHLLEAGATVAATTHSAELKAFASSHPGVTNAAVEFDVRTLRPTYRLTIGLPGKSQAFAIAERLGLGDQILADARQRLSAEHTSLEQTLAAVDRARREQADVLAAAEAERDAAVSERERARSGVSRARREAAEMLADARRAADQMLARAEREVADLRRELTRQRNMAAGRGGADRAAQAFDELRRRATQARAATAERAAGRHARSGAPGATDVEPEERPAPEARPGAWARSRTLGVSGRVESVSGRTGRVTLQTADGKRVVLPSDDVEPIPEPASGPTPRDEGTAQLRREAEARLATRLDLRGERVDAALERLDTYIDDALLAGRDEAVILHGAGTGALRRAIRERLAAHPRVRATRTGRREEGGDQATVAQL
jgi:DNA mismatch repair protein MutS2